VELGHSANRSADSGGAALDFKQAFINNSSLVIPSADCAVGNSYTPQAADDRLLFASISDGAEKIEVAAIPIKSVPFALQAEEIGGYGLANLMKLSGSGSSVTFSPEETQSLKDLLGNDLNWSMKSRKIENLADPTLATDAATKGWVLSQISVSGGGTISSIGFSAPSIFSVTGSPLTADGTITMNLASQSANRVFAGPSSGVDAAPTFRALNPADIPSLDASKITSGTIDIARLPGGGSPGGTAGGDLSGTYPNPSVAKINGVAVSSTAPTSASHVLKYNGTTQYAPGFIGVGDIRSTGAGNAAFFPLNCTSAQTTVWNSLTDVMDCTNISVSAAGVPTLDWSKIGTGKPTTLAGYGITDNLVSNLGGSPGIQSGADASKPGAPTAGTIYFATDTRIIYQFNSGSWSAIAQATGAAPGGSASGDLSGTYPAPSVVKLQGNAIASTTLAAGDAGKSYVWNGTSLTAKYFGIADLKNAAGTSYYPQCSASQTLTWVSATDTLTCSNIAIGDSAITYASQTQNKVLASPDGSTGAPAYRALAAGDIPGLDWTKITSGKPTTISGFGITDSLLYNGGQNGAVSIGSNDANSVTLKANNSAAMTILSSGNVGIGTTSPGYKLEVLNGSIAAKNDAGGHSRMRIETLGGGSDGYWEFWRKTDNGNFYLWDGTSYRLSIDNGNGNVGVGTTAPATKLHAEGSQGDDTIGTEDILLLGRAINSGVTYQKAAAFALGTYATSGNAPYSRLDIKLKSTIASDYIADSNVMTLQSNGNVGIGTTSPNAKLDIDGHINVTPGSQIQWQNNAGIYGNLDTLVFRTNNNQERMRIDSTGNVGIGTTSPGYRLEVVASSPGTARFSSSGSNAAGILIDNAAGGNQAVVNFLDAGSTKWQIGKQTTNHFFMYDVVNARDFFRATASGNVELVPVAGNVGVGTSSPGQKLTVAGTIESTTGGIKFPDGSTQTTAASGSAGLAPAFLVHRNGVNQSVTQGVQTKLSFPTTVFDTNSNWSAASNRFTATIAGKYLVVLGTYCPTGGGFCTAEIIKSGSTVAFKWVQNASPTEGGVTATAIVDMNGTTDYLEGYAQNSGGTTISGSASATYFTGALLAPLASGSLAGTGTASYLPI